jgi:hypothetical protein
VQRNLMAALTAARDRMSARIHLTMVRQRVDKDRKPTRRQQRESTARHAEQVERALQPLHLGHDNWDDAITELINSVLAEKGLPPMAK